MESAPLPNGHEDRGEESERIAHELHARYSELYDALDTGRLDGIKFLDARYAVTKAFYDGRLDKETSERFYRDAMNPATWVGAKHARMLRMEKRLLGEQTTAEVQPLAAVAHPHDVESKRVKLSPLLNVMNRIDRVHRLIRWLLGRNPGD